MEILVLGGTRFVGRKIAEAALERGHRVTLFNRGVTDPRGVPGAEQVAGDRTVGLDALAGRRWDAVIDTSSSVAANVRRAAEALAGAAGRYVFVSTISVYPDFGSERIDEDAPVHAPDFDSLRPGPWSYGPMKAACETIVRDTFGGRALVVRPGTLAGPGDVAGRFQWWLRRLAAGGEVLAPGRPDAPVQVADVRDLGAWIARMVEGGGSGTYNAAGCDVPLTMRAFLEAARAVAGSDARLTWVGDAFLLERGLNPWVELPFWERPEEYGTHRIDDRRARAAGLTFRPLLQTLRDVAAEGPLPVPALPVGITAEREAELLRAWHAHAAGHAPEEALAGAAA